MNKVRAPGQALTEYTLILVLASLVVIVVLALVGPAVGGVFNNVIGAVSTPSALAATATTAPTPTPTPVPPPPAGAWVFCAGEYNECDLPGTFNVRYGLINHYYYKIATTKVFCDNSIFGDPYVGYLKQCHYWDPSIP